MQQGGTDAARADAATRSPRRRSPRPRRGFPVPPQVASVAYPRPWNSGEIVYPTLITFGSPSATANPTSPTILPPSRSSTVNCTQPPGSPGHACSSRRCLPGHRRDRCGPTPAAGSRPDRCGTPRSSRHPPAWQDAAGGVRSGAVRTRYRRARPQRSGSPSAAGQDRRQLRGVDASSRHDRDDLARTREPRGCGRHRDRPRTFGHDVRPGGQEAGRHPRPRRARRRATRRAGFAPVRTSPGRPSARRSRPRRWACTRTSTGAPAESEGAKGAALATSAA